MRQNTIYVFLLALGFAIAAAGQASAYEYSVSDPMGGAGAESAQGNPPYIPVGSRVLNAEGDITLNSWDAALSNHMYILRNGQLIPVPGMNTNFIRDISDRDPSSGKARVLFSDIYGNNWRVVWENGSTAASLPPGAQAKVLSGDGHIGADMTLSGDQSAALLLNPNGTLRANIHAALTALNPNVFSSRVTAIASATSPAKVAVVGEVLIHTASGAIPYPFLFLTTEGVKIISGRRFENASLTTATIGSDGEAYAAGLASPPGQTAQYPFIVGENGLRRFLSRMLPLSATMIFQEMIGIHAAWVNSNFIIRLNWHSWDYHGDINQESTVRSRLTFNSSNNVWTETPPVPLSTVAPYLPNQANYQYFIGSPDKNGCSITRGTLGQLAGQTFTNLYVRPVKVCPIN